MSDDDNNKEEALEAIKKFRGALSGSGILDDYEKEKFASKKHVEALEKISELLERDRWGYNLTKIRRIVNEALEED